MNYDFRTKLTILFTLAVVVLATVGALVLMNANRFVAETEQAAETQKILEKIKASLYRLAMSESDLRGYLLYPDSTRRAAYEEDRDSLFVRLKELKALTGESHSLRERVAVDEDVAAVVASEEAEALLGVVPLDLAGGHGSPLQSCRDGWGARRAQATCVSDAVGGRPFRLSRGW